MASDPFHPTRDMATDLALRLGIDIVDSQSTAHPYWTIGYRWHGRYVVQGGVWLSHQAAQKHLEARRHRYHDRAFVFCHSGHASTDWRTLSTALRRPARVSEVRDGE